MKLNLIFAEDFKAQNLLLRVVNLPLFTSTGEKSLIYYLMTMIAKFSNMSIRKTWD